MPEHQTLFQPTRRIWGALKGHLGVWRAIGSIGSMVGLALQERRLLILQPFALICGVLAYAAAQSTPSAWVLIVVALTLFLSTFWSKNNFPVFVGLMLANGFWVGFCLLAIHGALFGTPMLGRVAYGTYTATVDKIHSDDGDRARLIISGLTPVNDSRTLELRRARILVPSEQRPGVGDQIQARMRLYKVPGPVVPFGYDSQFHSYFAGIGAFGSVTSELEIISQTQARDLGRIIDDVRRAIGQRVGRVLDDPMRGIARALMVGDQALIDDETRSTLANAGLAHVLAISGLHLSLVAGSVFAAIRLALAGFVGFGQRRDIKKIAAVGGIAVALSYLAISGASVSAIRATIMLLLVFGAVLAGRRALTMRNVAFAALIVIVTSPAAIFRPGFQLSFAAVVGLVGVYELYRPNFGNGVGTVNRIWRAAAGLALTSIIAGLATGLFAAYHFQQTAPFGVLGNIVAIPLVAMVILPSALLSVFAMPLGFEAIFLRVMGWGIEQILKVATFVSSISEGLVTPPMLTPTALFIGLAAMAGLAFFTSRIKYLAFVCAIPLIAIFGLGEPPDILIADSTQAVAVRDQGRLGLIAGRTGSFATNAWSETIMESIDKNLDGARCDVNGCYITSSSGFSLALVKTHDAFAEDCALADIVVTRLYAPATCRSQTLVIDRINLDRNGVHWARWTGDGFDLSPAITDVNRAWRPQN